MSYRGPPAVGNYTSEKYCWSPVETRGSPTVGVPMLDHCSPNIGKKYCGKPTSGGQGNVTVLPQLKSDVGLQSARGCEKNILDILPREASGRTTASHCRKPMSDQCRNSAEFRNGNPMSYRRPPAVGNHTSEKYCWSPVGARGSPAVGFPLSVRDRIHS